MAQQHQREYVYLNAALRKEPAIQNLSPTAFGQFVDLPSQVIEGPDGDHLLPDVSADEGTLDELTGAGLIEPLGDGVYRMTALARRYYAFEEPEGETIIDVMLPEESEGEDA